jgi:hypothetical protein
VLLVGCTQTLIVKLQAKQSQQNKEYVNLLQMMQGGLFVISNDSKKPHNIKFANSFAKKVMLKNRPVEDAEAPPPARGKEEMTLEKSDLERPCFAIVDMKPHDVSFVCNQQGTSS